MLKKIYDHFMKDSLYRNSIYLMLSTFVMGGLGFFFWMINARLFSTHDIGLAGTLIATISLITGFSLLGLNTGIVRFLATSKRRNHQISTAFTITAFTAILVSTIFLMGLSIWSPELAFVKQDLYYAIFFIGVMVIMTLFTLMDSVYIALRSTSWVLVKNSIFAVGKLGLPFVLVSLGAFGIFGAWTISAALGLLVAGIVLIVHFKYKPELAYYDGILTQILPYSFGNYVGSFIGSLPAMLLPIILTNRVSAETTAYYFIAMQLANILFTIPSSTTSSLFAEGSADAKNMRENIIKSAKITALLLVPAVLIIALGGNYLLLLFGKQYSSEGFALLRLLALSAPLIAVNNTLGTILMVRHKIFERIGVSVVSSAAILGLSLLLLPMGLQGIGIAWIGGQALTAVVYLFIVRRA